MTSLAKQRFEIDTLLTVFVIIGFLMTGLYLSSAKFFKTTKIEQTPLGEIVFRKNDIRLKYSGEISWSYKDTIILNNSTIYIGANSMAKISIGEKVVEANEEDTILFFSRKKNKLSISLNKGSIVVSDKTASDNKMTKVDSPQKQVEIYINEKKVSLPKKGKVIVKKENERSVVDKYINPSQIHHSIPKIYALNKKVIVEGSKISKKSPYFLKLYTTKSRQFPLLTHKIDSPKAEFSLDLVGDYYYELNHQNILLKVGKLSIQSALSDRNIILPSSILPDDQIKFEDKLPVNISFEFRFMDSLMNQFDYILIISKDESFSESQEHIVTPATENIIEFHQAGVYYWKVLSPKKEALFSPRQFEIIIPKPKPKKYGAPQIKQNSIDTKYYIK